MNHKLDVGNILERVVQVYRDQFGLLIPAAFAIFAPVALLNGLVLSSGGIFAGLAVAAIGVVATYWFQGMVVEAVRDILDGRRDHTVGSLFRSVAPVIGPLVVAGILGGLAIGIGFLLLIVPGLFLLTIWAVLAPVIVVERPPVFQAFGRSRELVSGNGWPVFGVILVLFLITLVASAVVQAILIAIADSFIGRFLADLIVRVLVSPLSAIAAAVLYFELKRAHGEPVEAGPAGVGAGDAPTQPQPQPAPGQPAPAPGGPGARPESTPPPPAPTETGPAQPGRPPAPEPPGEGPPPGGPAPGPAGRPPDRP